MNQPKPTNEKNPALENFWRQLTEKVNDEDVLAVLFGEREAVGDPMTPEEIANFLESL